MCFKQGRNCPICFKENVHYLGDHLRQVHQLSGAEKKNWLKSATYSTTKSTSLPYMPPYPFWGIPQYPMGMNPQLTQQQSQSQCTSQKTRKVAKIEASHCLETKPYPDYKFNHMFSMLVVGPSQCGKTYFVEQLLTRPCVKYLSKKPRRIYWFYNQWQPRYASLQSTLGDEIQFTQGLPALSEDLHEINPKFSHVLVFDDLMSQATEGPVLSKLFTQGRHRNASVILVLQNVSQRKIQHRYLKKRTVYGFVS